MGTRVWGPGQEGVAPSRSPGARRVLGPRPPHRTCRWSPAGMRGGPWAWGGAQGNQSPGFVTSLCLNSSSSNMDRIMPASQNCRRTDHLSSSSSWHVINKEWTGVLAWFHGGDSL